MKKKNVLILGAGPAGLTAAYELLNNGEYNVTILEKENQIGGLCKTIKFKNTLIDYGVHFYRISEYKKVNDILEDATINSKDINDTFKIFYMKNKFGYKDKQDIDANVNTEIKVTLTDD